jgi:hypothetical protein
MAFVLLGQQVNTPSAVTGCMAAASLQKQKCRITKHFYILRQLTQQHQYDGFEHTKIYVTVLKQKTYL